eukprot:c10340_g1_i1 orf=111-1067(+)
MLCLSGKSCIGVDLKHGRQLRCSVRVCRQFLGIDDHDESYGNQCSLGSVHAWHGAAHAWNHDIHVHCWHMGHYFHGAFGCIHSEMAVLGHVQSSMAQNCEICGYGNLSLMHGRANMQVSVRPCMRVQRLFTWNREFSHIDGMQSVRKVFCNVSLRNIHTSEVADGGMHTSEVVDGGMHSCMHVQSNFAWNREISSHVRSQQGKLAILVYNRMLQESMIPDKSTYILLLSIRSSSAIVLKFAKQLHSLIPSLGSDAQSDIMLGNVLISMYGGCNRFEYAKAVFCGLWERNVVSWNSMISVCVQHGRGQHALHLFDQMKQ